MNEIYLLSEVTWHNNGRTGIYPLAVSHDLKNLQRKVDSHGTWEYQPDVDLWRTAPLNVMGNQVLFSVSKIEAV